jgi:aminoglycoside 2'-N-acetyltransferase I
VTDVVLRWGTELTAADHLGLAGLFDSEYADDRGPWSPRTGYGYAAPDLHALALHDGAVVGHAGTTRRFIAVGDAEVLISGIGGVITHRDVRGRGVGRAVVTALQTAIRGSAPASFGLLGCREAAVPFYAACGFVRVDAVIRDNSPRDGATVVESTGPTMVCAGGEPVGAWPDGTIDLRGLPW